MSITLSELHIYPVKSLGGIALQEAKVTERGLEHDRRWMVVDPAGQFLTQREYPRMATVWVDVGHDCLTLAAPDRDTIEVPFDAVLAPALRVQVWNSNVEALAVSGAADLWLSEHLGTPCRLVHMPDSTRRECNPEFAGDGKVVSFADGYPFLVTSEASLADLNRRAGTNLPMNRFRPNLVVRGAGAWAEDHWKEFTVGEVRFRVAKPCGRCQVTTTDQASGEVRGPEPLATLATFRDSQFGVRFGMNLVALGTGTLRLGDNLEPAA
jgi:uncharacterized protein YcbX